MARIGPAKRYHYRYTVRREADHLWHHGVSTRRLPVGGEEDTKDMFTGALNSIISLIYPPSCYVCEAKLESAADLLCAECRASIAFNEPPFCGRCGRSLDADIGAPICGECLQVERHFDSALSACVYDGALKECLHRFKYNRATALSRLLGGFLTGFAEKYADLSGVDYIVPVPLYSARQRERGFNQSRLLAQFISEKHGIKLSDGNLYRKNAGIPQAQLSGIKERRGNLKGAFGVRSPAPFTDAKILLVDDVFTTGTTVNECSKALKGAGSKRVNVLTLARGI